MSVVIGDTSWMKADVVEFKPSAFYFRKAIRSAKSLREAQGIAMLLVLELGSLRSWARDLGMVPPKRYVLRTEADEKGWGRSRRTAAQR